MILFPANKVDSVWQLHLVYMCLTKEAHEIPLKREGFWQQAVRLFRHDPSMFDHIEKATAAEGSAWWISTDQNQGFNLNCTSTDWLPRWLLTSWPSVILFVVCSVLLCVLYNSVTRWCEKPTVSVLPTRISSKRRPRSDYWIDKVGVFVTLISLFGEMAGKKA